jgi:branched-subunit amino acid transport protein
MTHDAYVWLAILAITAATVVTRSALHVADSRWQLPPQLDAALRYAPGCALAAIVLPDLAHGADGALRLGLDNHRLLAALAAAGICAYTRSALGTILGGMGVFWLLRATLA